MAELHDTGKKTIQINVKMSEHDYNLIQRAAATLWPGAILSKGAIVLGLAKMAAKRVLTVK